MPAVESQLLNVALTSAVVAAFVSAVMSMLGQYLERKSRHQELLFNKAFELVKQRTDLVLKITEVDPTVSAVLPDDVFVAHQYYLLLKDLFHKGKLPPKYVAAMQEKLDQAKGNK